MSEHRQADLSKLTIQRGKDPTTGTSSRKPLFIGGTALILIAVVFGLYRTFSAPVQETETVTASLLSHASTSSLLTASGYVVAQRKASVATKATGRLVYLSIGGFMMMPFSSAFAINNLKITQEQLPLLFLFSGCSSLIIMPLVGRLADKVDKLMVFTIASGWMMVIVLLYTNLSMTPLWLVMILNVIIMMGIQGRMVPSNALTTELPTMHDRGAFMSINSSLQQIAGGAAAACAGMIVVQVDKCSPLEHYNTLGYVVVCIPLISILLLRRVSVLVKKKLGKEKMEIWNAEPI